MAPRICIGLTAVLIVTSLSFATLSVASQENLKIRESYAGTRDMPDGIAFQSLMSTWTGFPEIFKEPSVLATHINMVTGLDKRLAHEMVSYILSMATKIEAEARDAKIMVLCQSNLQSRDKASLAYMSDMADDVTDIVYEKYLMIIRTGLNTKQARAFEELLLTAKVGTSHTKLAHSEVFKNEHIEAITGRLESFCQQQKA